MSFRDEGTGKGGRGRTLDEDAGQRGLVGHVAAAVEADDVEGEVRVKACSTDTAASCAILPVQPATAFGTAESLTTTSGLHEQISMPHTKAGGDHERQVGEDSHDEGGDDGDGSGGGNHGRLHVSQALAVSLQCIHARW